MPGCRIDGAFTSAWMSPPGDTCQQCLPELSTTSWSPVNEGMSCWSGDPNAGATTCQSGVCTGQAAESCPPPTACYLEGTVNPVTGTCDNPPAPAGTPCGGSGQCHGEFYQPSDACDGNGFCIGGGAQAVSCAPYICGDGACTTTCADDNGCASGATCCDGSCVYLNTLEHCSGCFDTCSAVDACTPAECDNGACNEVSVCTPVDACTPAECFDNGTCNQTSTCTGYDTCGGGGVDDECGCTPVCVACGADGCGGICESAELTNPAINVTFNQSVGSILCNPQVHLSGFEGCEEYTAQYWVARTATGGSAIRSLDVNLDTDLSGAASKGALFVSSSSRWVEFRIGTYKSGWQKVSCPS